MALSDLDTTVKDLLASLLNGQKSAQDELTADHAMYISGLDTLRTLIQDAISGLAEQLSNVAEDSEESIELRRLILGKKNEFEAKITAIFDTFSGRSEAEEESHDSATEASRIALEMAITEMTEELKCF